MFTIQLINTGQFRKSFTVNGYKSFLPRNSETNFKSEGVYVTGYRYMIHFYCLAVETSFNSDVVECLPVIPATWVRFPGGAGKIFSLYDF